MTSYAVLLDMGGVLLDLSAGEGLPPGPLDHRGRQALLRKLGAGRRASPETLERLVFEPWRRQYHDRYRRGSEALWGPHLAQLRQQTGSRLHDVEMLEAWFAPFADQCAAMPGALQAVRSLADRGLKLAVVSNVPLPGMLYRRILARHGLESLFDAFQFSYDSGHRKPSPFMLRAALSEVGVPASRAVMVGDRRASDIAAGRAAGTATIWIESEHGKGPRPDRRVRSIEDLPGVIAELAG
jgi:HAD superfamily hydrolase (TIGR01662 family)